MKNCNNYILRKDIIRKIDEYLNEKIACSELTEWAEIVESNEDAEYEVGYEKKIADVLFYLSTPEINSVLTKESIKKYRTLLI